MHSKKSTTFAPAIRKLHPQFGVWCNGNTADSGPAFPGSSPGTPTRRKASNIWKLFFLLNTSILGCIKAGTGLHGVQVVMTYDEGAGIALFQFQEQLPQSLSLCLRACRCASEPVAVPRCECRQAVRRYRVRPRSTHLSSICCVPGSVPPPYIPVVPFRAFRLVG